MSGYLLAEFATPEDVKTAARRAAESGTPPDDALTSLPIEGLDAFLAPPHPSKPIGWVMFVAGVIGAIIGYGMQWFSAVLDYPINSGGRPLNSWPAFLLVPYETAILSAAIVGILTWMAMCGLPKLFHPLFAADVVERANQDRYVLVFGHAEGRAAWITATLRPLAVHEVQP
jgi:hypothetical protein